MRKNLIMILQKYITFLYLIVAICTFVYALGFITKFYGLYLYLSRVKEALSFYQNVLQPFNRDIFKKAIAFILLALMMYIFEFNRYKVGILGLILAIGTSIYTALCSLIFLNRLKTIKAEYLLIDISKTKNYSYSTITFEIGNIIYIVTAIVSLFLGIIVVVNFLSKFNKKEITANE